MVRQLMRILSYLVVSGCLTPIFLARRPGGGRPTCGLRHNTPTSTVNFPDLLPKQHGMAGHRQTCVRISKRPWRHLGHAAVCLDRIGLSVNSLEVMNKFTMRCWKSSVIFPKMSSNGFWAIQPPSFTNSNSKPHLSLNHSAGSQSLSA